MLLDAGATRSVLDNWGRSPMEVAHQHGEARSLSAFEAWGVSVTRGRTNPLESEVKSGGSMIGDSLVIAEFMARVKTALPSSRGSQLEPGRERGIFREDATLGREMASREAAEAVADDHPAPAPHQQTCSPSPPALAVHRGEDTTTGGGEGKSGNIIRVALSKVVEYPGDPAEVQNQLEAGLTDPTGRDMFGVTALMKFAAWDKVDLLDLLLNYLGPMSTDALNAQSPADGFTALHHAADMGAMRTYNRLTEAEGISLGVKDKRGRTAADILTVLTS
uniref:Uncharacterized protein n=1 Tax=Octactis speculum TaxID=3111310 RepID=A0A7S2FB57_9STRA